ncbi:MAG TPA: hypothetical protein PKE15_00965 [Ottowia sp.]|nr:hypothetical protein [Ottowia sp.]
MAAPLFPDPLQLWREAVNRLEADANALGTDSLKSPELLRSLQRANATGASMQQAYAKMADAYLQRANLPSRKQVAELAQALERIEQKLDRLLPPDPTVPRPARTRRPSAAASAAAPAEPVAAAPTEVKPEPAPARPSRARAASAKAKVGTRKAGRK